MIAKNKGNDLGSNISRFGCWDVRMIMGGLQQEGVLDMVKSRQVKWKARLENMSMERTTKKIFDGEMQGKRPRGRPRLRWTDNFK